MTSSAKTLRALERAAIRLYRSIKARGRFTYETGYAVYDVPDETWKQFNLAGAAHAAALKRKRTGRR